MPNWLPDWGNLREAGRLIWAIIASIIGTGLVFAFIRPPLRRKLLTPVQGVVAYLVVTAIGLGIYNLLAALTDNDGGVALLGVYVALVGAIAITAALVLSRTPRAKGDVTWTGATLGSTAVMAMFFLIYAVVPNEWIVFANSTLGWTKDNIYRGFPFDTLPFTWTGAVTNDIVATAIYVVGVAGTVLCWKLWQNRPDPLAALAEAGGEEAEGEALTVVGRSRFGRPLRAKA